MRCPQCKSECKFAHPMSKDIQDFGREDAPVIFIGEAPGNVENARGRVFVGPAGKKFWEMIEKVGIDKDQIYVTNAMKCWGGPQNKKPTEEDLLLCRKQLLAFIKKHPRKVIVPMGNVALYALFAKGTVRAQGISKKQGRMIEASEFGEDCQVLPLYHPSAILRQPYLQGDFEAGLRLLKNYMEAGYEKTAQVKTKVLMARSIPKAMEMFEQLRQAGAFAFDTETSGVDPLAEDFRVACISFCCREGQAWFLPLEQEGFFFWSKKEWAILYPELKELMEDGRYRKWCHNAKFDIEALLSLGIRVNGVDFDTMLAHHLLDENSSHELERCASKYLGFGDYDQELRSYLTELKKKRIPPELKSYSTIPHNILAPYACADADATFRLRGVFEPLLEEQGLMPLFKQQILPLIYILVDMESRGVHIDIPRAEALRETLEDKLRKIANEINILAQEAYIQYKRRAQGRITFLEGLIEKAKAKLQKQQQSDPLDSLILKGSETRAITNRTLLRWEAESKHLEKGLSVEPPINVNSPAQLSILLFWWMGYKPVRVSDANNPSTDEGTLKTLQKKRPHRILDLLLEYRAINKLNSTYVVGLLKRLDSQGRVHCDYLQHGTVTGRFASRNPNLQNIPRVGGIRELFIPAPGHKFVYADYGQAEVRAWAAYSKDPDLIRLLTEEDIHSSIASAVYNIPLEEFLAQLKSEDPEVATRAKEMRVRAKACITGDTLIYTNRGIIPIGSLPFPPKEDDFLDIREEGLEVLGQYGWTKVTHTYYAGFKPVYEVVTHSGRSFKATEDHLVRVLTPLGLVWRPVGSFQGGEWIARPRVTSCWPEKSSIAEEDAWLAGLALGFGHFEDGRIRVFIPKGQRHLLTPSIRQSRDIVDEEHGSCLAFNLETLNDLGFNVEVASDGSLFVKEWPLLSMTEAEARAFIYCFFEARIQREEGWGWSVTLPLSKTPTLELEAVLSNWGIYPQVETTAGRPTFFFFGSDVYRLEQAGLVIRPWVADAFVGADRRDFDFVPYLSDALYELSKITKLPWIRLSSHSLYKWKTLTTRSDLEAIYGFRSLLSKGVHQFVEQLRERDYHFEMVVDISEVGEAPVFDLTTEDQTYLTPLAINHNCVFGIMYGRGAVSLAEEFGFTQEEAQDFIDRLFARFPVAAKWRQDIIEQAKREKVLTSLTGRKRRLAAIDSSSGLFREEAIRQAVNFPIQSLAADLTNNALIRIYNRLMLEGLSALPVLQVHDCIIVEAPEKEVERVVAIMREEMLKPPEWFDVPLRVDIKVLDRWIGG